MVDIELPHFHNFSDVQFLIGGKTFHCLSALLVNASPYFAKMLKGPCWKENSGGPIPLADFTPEVFECVRRFCYGLDPRLSGDKVTEVLAASDFYDLQPLSEYCEEFIVNSLSSDTVLEIYSSMLDTKLSLSLERSFWDFILKNAQAVLDSHSFFNCDIRILKKVVSCDWFEVPEDDLWRRCISLEKGKLDALVPFLRYPLMENTFFVDNVRRYLLPEDSENILIHKLVGRPCTFDSRKRSYRNFPLIPTLEQCSSHELETAKHILGKKGLKVVLPFQVSLKFESPVTLTKIKWVSYADNFGFTFDRTYPRTSLRR